jgi:uncharacterized membrane protein
MADRRPRWTDQQVEQAIGSLLRTGLIIAAAVVVVGAVVYLVRHGGEQPHYRIFHGEPADLRSIGGIVRDSVQWRGTGLIQLGLVLLLATPLARVAFSVAAFALQRDRFYVVVTLIVMGILLFSILGDMCSREATHRGARRRGSPSGRRSRTPYRSELALSTAGRMRS